MAQAAERVPRAGRTSPLRPGRRDLQLLRAALLAPHDAAAAWRAVRPQVDIDHLPGEPHRLLPLIARNLTAAGEDDPDLGRLKGVYQKTWYRNQTLVAAVAGLLPLLGEANIEVVVLRGLAVLGHYGDAGLRQMRDADLLVAPEQRGAALDVLADQGWQPLPGDPRPHHPVTLRNGEGLLCTLHVTPTKNLVIDPASPHRTAGVWDAAGPAELGSAVVTVPNSADLVLLAVLDGARVGSWSTLRWIADAVVVLRRDGQFDWDLLIARAEQWRAALHLGGALSTLEELGLAVPAWVTERLQTNPAPAGQRWARRLAVLDLPVVGGLPQTLEPYLRASAGAGFLRGASGLPGYLCHAWGVPRRRDLPRYLARKARVYHSAR